MGLLYYLGPRIIFILSCMVVLCLAGMKSKRLQWITRSAGRWLGWWSLIGFAVAFVLGIVAWIMTTTS